MFPNLDNTIGLAAAEDGGRIAVGEDDRRLVTKRWLVACTFACVAAIAATLPCGPAFATDTSGDSRSASSDDVAEKSAVDHQEGAREEKGSEEKGSTGETEGPPEEAGDSHRGPGTLSIAPSDHVEYPEDRPEWIDAENDLRSPTHRWIVRTPPCETREECEDFLAAIFLSQLRQYGSALTGSHFADSLSVEDEELLKSLVARRYDGKLTQGNLPAYESALELQIGPDFQSRVWRHVRNGEVRQRIGAVGVMAAGGLALVVMLGGATAGISRHRASRESAESRNAAA